MMKKRTHTIFSLPGLIIFSLVVATSGCSSGPAHFQRRVSASNTFERFNVLPHHQYYYFGRPDALLAVVAIDKGHRLNSPNWTATDMDEQTLKSMVGKMRNQPGAEYNIDPNGAYILDDDGETIGLWYSVWRLPLLRFTGEKEFTISDPHTIFPINNREPDGDGIIWPGNRP
ncbi:MAG: hypothetical protein PVJ84_11665 [Desulfobacteraceae bacterium]|jgi:hypothetical protein